jgi:ribosomal protein S6--L-glutamate ligase
MQGLKKCSRSAQDMDPRLVILTLGPELYSTKRLIEEAEKEGWAVKLVDYRKVSPVVDDKGVRIYYNGWPIQCDAIIPRIGASYTHRGVPVVKFFESMGVIVINGGEGIRSSRDKLRAGQILMEAGVPVPTTVNVGAWEDTIRAVNQVGGTPCVVKSNEGTHGSTVFLARTEQQARQLVYQMLDRGMRPLVQEYIRESHGQDIRALVVGGKVVAAMRRKAHGSEFRSNFHLGGSVEPVEISDRYAEIACTAAEALGLDLAGVDMLESRSGPLVLEVNSSPGLEGIESVKGKGFVAAEVVRLLNRRLEESREDPEASNSTEMTGASSEASGIYD